MIRAVFFDLDETLVDAMACHLQASRQAFAQFALDYDQACKLSSGYNSLGRRINEILEFRRNILGVNQATLPLKKLTTARENIFLKCVSQKAKLLPGARQAVIHARKNSAIVAVTSSGTRKYINLCLKKFNLQPYIDFIVGEQDVNQGKPHPEIYNQAFSLIPKKLNIKKSQCLVIEDSVNGAKAAQAANFKVVFIPSKYTRGIIKADYQLSSLKQFNLTNFTT